MLSHLGWQDCSICGVLSLTNVTLHSPSLTQVELNLTKLPVSRFVLFSTATCWSARPFSIKNLGGERLILKAVYHGLIAIRPGSSSLKNTYFPSIVCGQRWQRCLCSSQHIHKSHLLTVHQQRRKFLRSESKGKNEEQSTYLVVCRRR